MCDARFKQIEKEIKLSPLHVVYQCSRLELKMVMFQSHGTHLSGLAPSLSVYRSSKSLAQTLRRQSAASAVCTVAPGFGTTANMGRRCLLTLCKQQPQQRLGLLSTRHSEICCVYTSSQTDKNRYVIVRQSCRREAKLKLNWIQTNLNHHNQHQCDISENWVKIVLSNTAPALL